VDWVSRLPVEQAEHEEIAAALQARDLPRPQAALRAHILGAGRSMMAGLGT
jgi:DNA-binding GntR family transcriptional regulator